MAIRTLPGTVLIRPGFAIRLNLALPVTEIAARSRLEDRRDRPIGTGFAQLLDARQRILIIGEGELSEAGQRALEAAEWRSSASTTVTDREMRETLSEDFDCSPRTMSSRCGASWTGSRPARSRATSVACR